MLDYLLDERKKLEDYFTGRADIEFTDEEEQNKLKESIDSLVKEVIDFEKERQQIAGRSY
jgi:hypothetical protein